LALVVCGPALPAGEDTAAGLPSVTTSSPLRIWVDQIGYRAQGKKMAVVASDAALPAVLEIELRDAKTGAAVWRLVEVLDWRQKPWEFTEPDIGYQVAVCQLLSAFTWPR
jgi:hypothetical protein